MLFISVVEELCVMLCGWKHQCLMLGFALNNRPPGNCFDKQSPWVREAKKCEASVETHPLSFEKNIHPDHCLEYINEGGEHVQSI